MISTLLQTCAVSLGHLDEYYQTEPMCSNCAFLRNQGFFYLPPVIENIPSVVTGKIAKYFLVCLF